MKCSKFYTLSDFILRADFRAFQRSLFFCMVHATCCLKLTWACMAIRAVSVRVVFRSHIYWLKFTVGSFSVLFGVLNAGFCVCRLCRFSTLFWWSFLVITLKMVLLGKLLMLLEETPEPSWPKLNLKVSHSSRSMKTFVFGQLELNSRFWRITWWSNVTPNMKSSFSEFIPFWQIEFSHYNVLFSVSPVSPPAYCKKITRPPPK